MLNGLIIVAAISAFLGFIFGNLSGWIAKKSDRQKLIQERYTKQYITDGIDPLFDYFVHKEWELKTASYGDNLSLPEASPLPTNAEAAIRKLCGDRRLAKAISGINAEYGRFLDIIGFAGLDTDMHKDQLKETITYVEQMSNVLLRARKDLEEQIENIGWWKNLLNASTTCAILNEIGEYETQQLQLWRQIMREKNRGTSPEAQE